MAIPTELDVLRALAALPEGETWELQDFKAPWDVQGGMEFRELLALLTHLQRAGWIRIAYTYTQGRRHAITPRGREKVEREEDWLARTRRRAPA